MHPTENVGGEKGCVMGKGDVLVEQRGDIVFSKKKHLKSHIWS